MRKWNKVLLLLITISLLSGMTVPALAANRLNMNQKGSITVIVRDITTKKPIRGGSVALYRVASVKDDGEKLTYTYTDEFKDFTKPLNNIQSHSLAASLANYAIRNDLNGLETKIGKDGSVVFEDLEVGLYLVMQLSAADGYSRFNPFLISIPMETEDGSLSYVVKALPKAEPIPDKPSKPDKPDKPNRPDQPDNPPDNPPVTPPEYPEDYPDDYEEEIIPDEEPPLAGLPQTGQLWWPVPVLAVAGLACFAFGWMKQRYEEE